ncbi:uncharacterized protein FA14DRAFT_185336 [Meira miltonrushii]|uniref:RNA polymerase I associated factor, A49-like protein n=1 Tax=Meira miltonrushii TaxID=1280837 RepID=A0A316VE97_9BASI|nr:uncharacterized protein FA14DRAFT_185336 [Meira miltonrushii]PWN33795.1 hypothetical protein FA14DRAFT_185336 [Meira miltonrushii]
MGEKSDKKEKRSRDASSSSSASKKARKSQEASEHSISQNESGVKKGKGKAKDGQISTSADTTQDRETAKIKTLDQQHAYDVGAVLVSASDFALPKDIPFTLHHQPGSTSASQEQRGASLEDGLILSGESDSMDYVGWNWDLNASVGNDSAVRRDAKGYSGEYLVGIYDPEERTVTLRAAPMFNLRRSVKSLSNLSINGSSGLSDWQKRVVARRDLGEAFGNRKTKAKARAEDRMKVDTSNMLDIVNTLQDGIEDTKQNIPSIDEMNAEAEHARPIPPPNFKAQTPHEAYPLEVLIPDAIFRLLNTRTLEGVESQAELAKALPVRASQSPWLKERIWNMIQSAKFRKMNQGKGGSPTKAKVEFDEDGLPIENEDESSMDTAPTNGILKTSRQDARTKLKVAFYISILWSFLSVARGGSKGGEKEQLLFKLRLHNLPGGDQILADLFSQFTEQERGSKRGSITNFTETKLYAYMFALCLHLEDFSIDTAPLARDLTVPPTKVTDIFRSLGCTSANKTVTNSDGTSRAQRRTILKIPFELPKPRKGRRN